MGSIRSAKEANLRTRFSPASGRIRTGTVRRYTHQLEVEARDGIAKLDTYLHEDR